MAHTAATAAERAWVWNAVSPHATAEHRIETAGADETLPMAIALRVQHEAGLEALLAAQQQPGSPAYQQWLTPEEFAERFAPSPQAYAAVVEWLQHAGFTVHVWPNRLRVDFAGPVAAVERSFGVHMSRYEYRGRRVLANEDAPSIPLQLADSVDMVRLHTFPVAEPMLRLMASSGPINVMAPHDIYVAYDAQPVLDRGLSGAGQTVAVVARSNFRDSDVAQFQQQFGVRVRNAVRALPGDDPGIGAIHGRCQNIHDTTQYQQCVIGEEAEVLLDVQWAGVMAPGANLLVDISDADVDKSIADVINHHAEAKIVSVSFGGCERQNPSALSFFSPLYAQAAAQGQTVLVSTGDSGADGCQDGAAPSVSVLASDPHVIAVGGTALNPGFDAQGNATQYVSETVWHDAQGAGGGGASTLVTKPAYQVVPGVPADGARDQPDVALLASPTSAGYVIIFEGSLGVVGGTSVAAPTWAGLVALLNHAAGANGLGALNPRLYGLGQRQYADGGRAVFHDVTTGNNSFNGVSGATAGPGFDLASGLGTPNVDALAQAFSPSVCAGDCNGDGAVTVDELIVGVDIAMGIADVASCPAMDANHDGEVTINELIGATSRALSGC